MKRMTMVLTIMLAVITGGYAQFGGGTGTDIDPYQIKTVAHLKELADSVNGGKGYIGEYFKLINDLDLNVAPYNTGAGWVPIGIYYNNSFKGNFDGNGKKISNLFIDAAAREGVGLFDFVDGATIANLGIENVDVTGRNYVGGLAGRAYYGNISNCYVTGEVSGDSYTAGVVGYISYNPISNCYYTGKVSGVYSPIGGIVGCASNSTVNSCYSIGEIIGGSYAGGIVGEVNNNCTISNCYSTSKVSGTNTIGGVVGMAIYNCTVSNCYSTGEVRSESGPIGGLVGFLAGYSTVSNCAALNPSVKAIGSGIGRVVGILSGTNTLSNNIAYDNMLNNADTTDWANKGANQQDGLDISKEDINADSTLGGRFASPIWATAVCYLPGFGVPVDMPVYLQLAGAPAISTLSLPNGKVGTAYNQTITSIGDPIIVYNISNGVLPTGLSLNAATGVISGMPSLGGEFTFSVRASNSLGAVSKEYTVEIATPVTQITGVPTSTDINTLLELTATVVPSTADYQDIVWTVENVGSTNAVIVCNTYFFAKNIGTARN